MMGHVFISYGRRDAAAFVARLQPALEAAGHRVFVDRSGLVAGAPWDESLADAIDSAKAVIAVLSPHAVRRASDPGHGPGGDSVCLDEIVRARDAGRRIVPVMVERCEVPLTIARLNYIDLIGWQTNEIGFHNGLAALLDTLRNGDVALPQPHSAAWDSTSLLAAKAQDFQGREWLFCMLEDWATTDATRTLLLLGPPGIGKSAFVAELLRRDAGRRVVAHHLFQSETPATRDAGRFVLGLAAQLGGSVPGYAAAVRAPETARLLTPSFCDTDPASALEGAVLAPLARLAPPEGLRFLLLDALDEALPSGVDRLGYTVPGLLAPRLDRFPPWLRLVVTARPDPAALRGFERARRIRLDAADARNRADLATWLQARLPAGQAVRLAALADGSFLYARLAVDALGRSDLAFEIAELPPGLNGLFSRFFQRSFPTEAAYAPARQVLSVMLAAREILPEATLAAVTHLAPGPARAVFDALAPYLDRGPDGLALHHKALADWLTDAAGGDPMFLVDRAAGAGLLLDWCRSWAADTAPGYRTRNFAAHLTNAGAVAELQALLRAGGFHAARAAQGEDNFALAADWGELAAALLASGQDLAAARLAVTDDAACRDAVAAAIGRAALPLVRLAPVLAAMRAPGVAGTAAQAAALRLAAAAGLAAPLVAAAHSRDAALISVAVPEFYRLLRDHPAAGWAGFEQLLAGIPNRIGLPRRNIMEVAAGISFAILTRDLADAETLARLRAAWRGVVQATQRGPLARLAGHRWVRAPLRPMLRALMARQPDYQPLNYSELRTAFSRPPAAHAPALEIIACLEDPSLGTGPALNVLTRPGLTFDVHLMLAAERTLIRLGAVAPAGVLDLLGVLMEAGPAWFRQSILYIGFHVLHAAEAPPVAWLDRYAAWAYATIGPDRATLTTDGGRYALVPHMAWPMVVLHRHGRAAEGRFIADWLAQAARQDDLDFSRRALRATGVLSTVYRLDALALQTLRESVLRDVPGLRPDLVLTLANIRFSAAPLVDAFLTELGQEALRARVAITAPTLLQQDFPTWIDAFFNQMLIADDGFRQEVVQAFRMAAGARSADELIGLVVDWVVRLLGGDPAKSPDRRRPGAAPAAPWREETPP